MNLHRAVSTASIAAQPLGGGVATEKKALSILLHRDGIRGKAQGNPNPTLPCMAAGVTGPGEAGEAA